MAGIISEHAFVLHSEGKNQVFPLASDSWQSPGRN